MKIFGIGLNKTGTKTLGRCMSELGFRNRSYDLELFRDYARGDYSRIMEETLLYDSFEDWPWPLLYREFDRAYPDARFILTTRLDAETWFRSLCRHAERTGPTEARRIAYGHLMPMEDPAHHIAFYNAYNAEVRTYFEGRSSRLLEVCWERGDGWQPVCEFLGLPIPVVPFPHENKA